MTGLTRNELDHAICAAPDCTHEHDNKLVLHSRCHPRLATWATYDRQTGLLTVRCSKCSTVIATIEVAKGGPGARAH